MAKVGRPTKYTKDLGNDICKRIIEGESLKKISEDNEMPVRSTIHEWLLDEEKKEFSDNYELAVNVRTENMFDDIEDIASNKGEVQRDRLRVDVRKWYLSKVLPKKYGDKMDLTSGGEKIKGNTIIFKEFKKDATDSE